MSPRPRARANGEGSIFPYRNGFAAYVWVHTPTGHKRRKWVYGKTREVVHEKWIQLQAEARRGPLTTSSVTVAAYSDYWLREVVQPNLKPKTFEKYEGAVRLYIGPMLGQKRLDRLTVREVRTWLNQLRRACQCCAHRRDARRPAGQQRCCAVGACCEAYPSGHVVQVARNVLRGLLSNAEAEELVTRNVAAVVKVPPPPKRRGRSWSVEEARQFLESARRDQDLLCNAYVLILVLGLRKGEVLGLAWEDVNLDAGQLHVNWQLQRVGGRLQRVRTKTESSAAPLPLPDICVAALRQQLKRQETARATWGDGWDDNGLVFTNSYGGPADPRGFNRGFSRRCEFAGVPRIRVHDTRRTCASLLAALDVHPRVAMQILRHSQIAVTMNIYTEVSSSDTLAALKRLGDSLDG
jgi:integrase